MRDQQQPPQPPEPAAPQQPEPAAPPQPATPPQPDPAAQAAAQAEIDRRVQEAVDAELQAEQAAAQAEIERRVQEGIAAELARRAEAQQTAHLMTQAERDQAAREAADQWPSRGYDGPPPWDIARVHGSDEHELRIDTRTGNPSGTPVPYTGPAAVTHSEPLLTYGSAGEAVERLVGLLARLGYEDTRDPNARAAQVLDNSVMASVRRFQGEHGVAEGLDQFQGLPVPATQLAEHHVGPYTWQALYQLAPVAA